MVDVVLCVTCWLCLHIDFHSSLIDLLQPGPIRIHKKVIFCNVWAGSYATFAQCRKTSAIYAWGLNNYNQLGVNESKSSYFPQIADAFSGKAWAGVAVGQHHTLALDEEGKVFAVGRGDYGRLGLGNSEHTSTLTQVPNLEGVTQIACGTACSFAVTSKGWLISFIQYSEIAVFRSDKNIRLSIIYAIIYKIYVYNLRYNARKIPIYLLPIV